MAGDALQGEQSAASADMADPEQKIIKKATLEQIEKAAHIAEATETRPGLPRLGGSPTDSFTFVADS
eukprot:g52631.t1